VRCNYRCKIIPSALVAGEGGSPKSAVISTYHVTPVAFPSCTKLPRCFTQSSLPSTRLQFRKYISQKQANSILAVFTHWTASLIMNNELTCLRSMSSRHITSQTTVSSRHITSQTTVSLWHITSQTAVSSRHITSQTKVSYGTSQVKQQCLYGTSQTKQQRHLQVLFLLFSSSRIINSMLPMCLINTSMAVSVHCTVLNAFQGSTKVKPLRPAQWIEFKPLRH
jgi:hypothetical protein